MLPRRFKLVFGLAAFFAFALIYLSLPSSVDVHSVAKLPTSLSNLKPSKLPSISSYNPFGQSAHEPPVQANSTSGGTSWFSDWKWRNPFSSTITLDENRAVLPPLRTRPPVYTFYESDVKKDKAIHEAENELLLTWRRAWWAQGFEPVVLGRPEAMKNPLYESLHRLQLEDAMERELARWLAWGNMGTGILADWLALPMAPYEDSLLMYLRRGDYPQLTRYDGLHDGVFCGDKVAINEAIKQALSSSDISKTLSMVKAVKSETFNVDPKHDSIAYYSRDVISNKYKTVAESLDNKDEAKGLRLLAELINSHLHTIWQNRFPAGISVLKPLPEHMTALMEPAIDLARNLSQCPTTSMPSSCPPNAPRCQPCVSSKPMIISTPLVFRNASTLFTIGTVPHPYTTTSLHYEREPLDIKFVRRLGFSSRDQWLYGVTKEVVGSSTGPPARLVVFKDAVASEWGTARSIWLTAEHESPDDLDWIFGFALPREASDSGKSETPVPGPERRPLPPKPEGPAPTEDELKRERSLLARARETVRMDLKDRKRRQTKRGTVEAVEAWNLADTEAWRFSRSFSARRRVERLKWEEEERKFAGAESRKDGWGRWFDRST